MFSLCTCTILMDALNAVLFCRFTRYCNSPPYLLCLYTTTIWDVDKISVYICVRVHVINIASHFTMYVIQQCGISSMRCGAAQWEIDELRALAAASCSLLYLPWPPYRVAMVRKLKRANGPYGHRIMFYGMGCGWLLRINVWPFFN